MRLPKSIKAGTRVDCNVRGRKFTAIAVERTDEGLRIEPPANHTYYHVVARQVTKIHKWDPYATQITNPR